MDINFNIQGVTDAINALKNIIDPKLRATEHKRAELANKERQAEIRKLEAEQKIIEAQSLREAASIETDKTQGAINLAQAKKIEAEAALVMAQAQKAQAEAETLRNQVQLARIEMAMRIVEVYFPNSHGAEKFAYIAELLPTIEQFEKNSFRLAPGNENTPATDTEDQPT